MNMKNLFVKLFFLVLGLLALGHAADKVYYNANIYTSDKNHPRATALVVSDDKIIYVGNDEEAKVKVPDSENHENMEQKLILPGFIDSHCHPLFYGAMRAADFMIIDAGWDHEKTLKQVKQFAEKNPNRPVIFGMGFGVDCRVLASELDKVVSDRPVLLLDSGCHIGWVNTAAMRMMNLNKDTPDPMPGIQYYERDTFGNPNGKLVEALPEQEAWEKLGVFSPKMMEKGVSEVLQIFAKNGVTGVFDAGMFNLVNDGHQILLKLEKEGKLAMRYHSCSFTNPTHTVQQAIEQLESLNAKYRSELVNPHVLKLQNDGTVEGFSASMQSNYEGEGASHGRGIRFYTIEKMVALGKAASDLGYDVHIHAIGDQAVSDTLDAFKQMGELSVNKTMAHVQVLPKDGIERFTAQKDIFYQTTPVWLGVDDFTESVLGSERYLRQMPLKSLVDKGVLLSFGSDCPASDGEYGMNPLENIKYAALRNVGDKTKVMPPMNEGISVHQAIDAYTINAAKQLGVDDVTGSITVGKSADFIVIDQNILDIPIEKIGNAKVLRTVFKGKNVYAADENNPKKNIIKK